MSAGLQANQHAPIEVALTRPDGTVREFSVSGHFREEHLCTVIDEELSKLKSGTTLVLRLVDPDVHLTSALRKRWREGLSDNRFVQVHEVLAPSGTERQLLSQLNSILRRMKTGEAIDLAIRSPEVARLARGYLRELLLTTQETSGQMLRVWVHGSEEDQMAIMDELDGMSRVQDLSRDARPRWRQPFVAVSEVRQRETERRPAGKRSRTLSQAVENWIRKVERTRSHPSDDEIDS